MRLTEEDRILDEYLVVSSQAGSRTAFDQLARRWTPRLTRYAARTMGSESAPAETVRDIVQETWLAVIRGIGRLDDPAYFPAWIYSIATHKCADSIRSAMRSRRHDRELEAAISPPELARSHPRESHLDLAAAIAQLPEHERRVVHLYYGEDLRVSEIATALGIPPGTVKSRLHQARQALKQFLQFSAAPSRIERTS